MARGPQFADLGCGGPWTKDWTIRHCETWAQKRKVVQIVSLNLEGDCFQGVCVCFQLIRSYAVISIGGVRTSEVDPS